MNIKQNMQKLKLTNYTKVIKKIWRYFTKNTYASHIYVKTRMFFKPKWQNSNRRLQQSSVIKAEFSLKLTEL